MEKNRDEIIINCSDTGQKNEQGEPEYAFNYVVSGGPGAAFFGMLTDFFHKAPDWVTEHFKMALKFNDEHDRENCPDCQAAKKGEKKIPFEDWKAELIRITARATEQSERRITINDNTAREWYDSGATPWQTFRENWDSDDD